MRGLRHLVCGATDWRPGGHCCQHHLHEGAGSDGQRVWDCAARVLHLPAWDRCGRLEGSAQNGVAIARRDWAASISVMHEAINSDATLLCAKKISSQRM